MHLCGQMILRSWYQDQLCWIVILLFLRFLWVYEVNVINKVMICLCKFHECNIFLCHHAAHMLKYYYVVWSGYSKYGVLIFWWTEKLYFTSTNDDDDNTYKTCDYSNNDSKGSEIDDIVDENMDGGNYRFGTQSCLSYQGDPYLFLNNIQSKLLGDVLLLLSIKLTRVYINKMMLYMICLKKVLLVVLLVMCFTIILAQWKIQFNFNKYRHMMKSLMRNVFCIMKRHMSHLKKIFFVYETW